MGVNFRFFDIPLAVCDGDGNVRGARGGVRGWWWWGGSTRGMGYPGMVRTLAVPRGTGPGTLKPLFLAKIPVLAVKPLFLAKNPCFLAENPVKPLFLAENPVKPLFWL